MKTQKLVCLFLGCSLLFLAPVVYGEVVKGDIGLGLNYPGVGVRYFLSDKISLELKSQSENNIILGGFRGYWYFRPIKTILPFAGVEVDYASFKGNNSEGTGITGEVFAGIEHFFVKSFSVQLDFGPAIVSLTDKGSSESVNDLEYVVNFGINYYFGKK
ncbi:MAG: hypothetical protein WC955_02375 [Elusimicrobiota bacterium]